LQAKAIPGAGPEIAYLVGTPENLRAARSIAEASLTLYRDPEKLLPVKPGQGLLIVLCRKMEPGQADPLAQAMSGASLQYVGLEPTEAQAKQAAEAAAQSGLVVVLTYDAVNHPAQRSLLRTLLSVKPRKLVHVASGSPYDLTLFPGSQACVATYGDVPVSMEALAKGLTGQISLSGRLPVKLP
jgi:beta-N-acetylhexosaminidase